MIVILVAVFYLTAMTSQANLNADRSELDLLDVLNLLKEKYKIGLQISDSDFLLNLTDSDHSFRLPAQAIFTNRILTDGLFIYMKFHPKVKSFTLLSVRDPNHKIRFQIRGFERRGQFNEFRLKIMMVPLTTKNSSQFSETVEFTVPFLYSTWTVGILIEDGKLTFFTNCDDIDKPLGYHHIVDTAPLKREMFESGATLHMFSDGVNDKFMGTVSEFVISDRKRVRELMCSDEPIEGSGGKIKFWKLKMLGNIVLVKNTTIVTTTTNIPSTTTKATETTPVSTPRTKMPVKTRSSTSSTSRQVTTPSASQTTNKAASNISTSSTIFPTNQTTLIYSTTKISQPANTTIPLTSSITPTVYSHESTTASSNVTLSVYSNTRTSIPSNTTILASSNSTTSAPSQILASTSSSASISLPFNVTGYTYSNESSYEPSNTTTTIPSKLPSSNTSSAAIYPSSNVSDHISANATSNFINVTTSVNRTEVTPAEKTVSDTLTDSGPTKSWRTSSSFYTVSTAANANISSTNGQNVTYNISSSKEPSIDAGVTNNTLRRGETSTSSSVVTVARATTDWTITVKPEGKVTVDSIEMKNQTSKTTINNTEVEENPSTKNTNDISKKNYSKSTTTSEITQWFQRGDSTSHQRAAVDQNITDASTKEMYSKTLGREGSTSQTVRSLKADESSPKTSSSRITKFLKESQTSTTSLPCATSTEIKMDSSTRNIPGSASSTTLKVKGEKGEQGIPGYNGSDCDCLKLIRFAKPEKGSKGIKGDRGLKGDIGLPGDSGTNGTCSASQCTSRMPLKGKKGETGPPGYCAESLCIGQINLLKGAKGETGITGSPGPKGDKGEKPELSTIVNSIFPDVRSSIEDLFIKTVRSLKGEPGTCTCTNDPKSPTPNESRKPQVQTIVLNDGSELRPLGQALPLGQMVFLIVENILLIKVDEGKNRWRIVKLDDAQSDWVVSSEGDQNLPSRPLEPTIDTNSINSNGKRLFDTSYKLMLISLPKPTAGDLRSVMYEPGAYSGSSYQCQKQAYNFGLGRAFYPLINTDTFDFYYMVPEKFRYNIPIVNRQNEKIAQSFEDLTKLTVPIMAAILDFEGNSIMSYTNPPCIWIGRKPTLYEHKQPPEEGLCLNWMSRRKNTTGTTTKLVLGRPLLDINSIKEIPCRKSCFVLCMQIYPLISEITKT